MSELNIKSLDNFIESVTSGAEEAAAAFQRTFDTAVTIAAGAGGTYNVEAFSSKIGCKGLALLFIFGGRGIAVLIPDSTGIVPKWCNNPDVTGKSKLSTFAQEWGMNLVPEAFFPEDYKAAMVENMERAMVRGGIELAASYLDINLTKADGNIVTIYIVWALDSPSDFFNEKTKSTNLNADTDSETIPNLPKFDSSKPPLLDAGVPNFESFGTVDFNDTNEKRRAIDDLPGYSRSLLKVKVPVAAVLATARKPIKSILELGVGSVIQFDKSCDELLEVEVGQKVTIGSAEAVKVGDKFGFRIHTMVLPEERFRTVEIRHEGEYHTKTESPQIIGKAPVKSFN
ncbi:MAG: FliM/FliN family flagellar motor C-terminal domain-containing protein [Planctomycetaceae bacterium]|jgi:flagellar motor switch/type III secretory pathway protein FliN|nr:FliM/FliN family flagellar motor C-terminal domain-containing protein [Planctomycetaceae bacterium]